MEAVKNRLTVLFWDTRPFIVDADPDFLFDMCRGNFHQPARRREADRIIYDVVYDSGQSYGFSYDDSACCAVKSESHISRLPTPFPRFHQLTDQFTKIDRLESCPGELRIGPCRF